MLTFDRMMFDNKYMEFLNQEVGICLATSTQSF